MLERDEQTGLVFENKEREPRVLFSLIIPTRNEIDNVNPLFKRLSPVLSKYHAEVIFVDDSDDNTSSALRNKDWTFPVNIIHRKRGERKGGLSTAVLQGIAVARGDYIGVMDADLQHPPELLPNLLTAINNNNSDIVIASRFVEKGSLSGLSGPIRKLGSKGTIFLIHALFPELKKVRDPMSGFFLFNKKILDGETELNPQGFKILFELLIKSHWVNLSEIPLQFEKREHGKSKLDIKEIIYTYSYMLRSFKEKHSKITS